MVQWKYINKSYLCVSIQHLQIGLALSKICLANTIVLSFFVCYLWNVSLFSIKVLITTLGEIEQTNSRCAPLFLLEIFFFSSRILCSAFSLQIGSRSKCMQMRIFAKQQQEFKKKNQLILRFVVFLSFWYDWQKICKRVCKCNAICWNGSNQSIFFLNQKKWFDCFFIYLFTHIKQQQKKNGRPTSGDRKES